MTSFLAQAANLKVSPWVWAGFFVLVVVVMALDLGVFHRNARQMRVREALVWVGVWVLLALLFNLWLFYWKGGQIAFQFLLAYLVELALSVDNLFVFLVIFSYFSVPPQYQHRVLFWGIIGAVATRIPFIMVGVAVFERFLWVTYIFGVFLVYTGFKLLRHEPEVHPEKNIVLRLARRFLPVTDRFHAEHFFVREVEAPRYETAPGSATPQTAADPRRTASATKERVGRWVATPLFLVLLVVDATDIVFAVDSVPAVIAVAPNLFLATTSNIFAILGLRAMYFVLLGFLDKFHFLNYGLSLVLMFIGGKMLVEDFIHISEIPSLFVVLILLGGSVVLSVLFPPKKEPLSPDLEQDGGDEG